MKKYENKSFIDNDKMLLKKELLCYNINNEKKDVPWIQRIESLLIY